MTPIKSFILEKVKDHPKDLVKVVMEKFQVSRPAVFYQIQKLKEEGFINQIGSRNKVRYELLKKSQGPLEKFFQYRVGEKDESEIWQDDIAPALGKLPKNIEDICRHGFTEMFNNVIDHSGSPDASVVLNISKDLIKIFVMDKGIGIFKKIQDFFHLPDIRDAVVKLHQGKLTTDRTRHSGEGIFFTSRMFDSFTLMANGYRYLKDNSQKDDWYFEYQNDGKEQGTCVVLEISPSSQTKIEDIFKEFTNPDSFKFDKSHWRIELANYKEDRFVSRSQAKRLISGLGDFKTIILDFKNVRAVGQAFVDELFGVFGIERKDINFIVVNANDDILFMIKRGLAERNFPPNRIQMKKAI